MEEGYASDDATYISVLKAEFAAGRQDSPQAQAALSGLLDSHDHVVRALLLAKGIPPQDVDDLVHDVFVSLLQALRKYWGDITRVSGYLRKIAERRVADYWEDRQGARRGAVKPLLKATSLHGDDGQLTADPESDQEGPAALAEQKDSREYVQRQVHDLIAGLPDEETKEIATRFIGGSGVRAIAHDMGLGLGKVRSRLKQVLHHLRRALAELGTE